MSPGVSQPMRPSSSCPAAIAHIKMLDGLNLTDEEWKLIAKDRLKKETHNMSKSSINKRVSHQFHFIINLSTF